MGLFTLLRWKGGCVEKGGFRTCMCYCEERGVLWVGEGRREGKKERTGFLGWVRNLAVLKVVMSFKTVRAFHFCYYATR